jgi:hypothetical protein
MESSPSSLSVARVFSSISVGALGGGAVTTCVLLLVGVVQQGLVFNPLGLLFFTPAAALAWWIGMAVFGIVPWLILDSLGIRSRQAAALLGLMMTFAVSFSVLVLPSVAARATTSMDNVILFSNGTLTGAGWLYYGGIAGANAAIGVLVALAVWQMAYGRFRHGAEIAAEFD